MALKFYTTNLGKKSAYYGLKFPCIKVSNETLNSLLNDTNRKYFLNLLEKSIRKVCIEVALYKVMDSNGHINQKKCIKELEYLFTATDEQRAKDRSRCAKARSLKRLSKSVKSS